MVTKNRTVTIGGKTRHFIDMKGLLKEFQDVLKKELGKLSEANAVIRYALVEAGKMWIVVFLPKRFDENYAKSVLGYHANAGYEAFKVQAASSGARVSFTRDHADFEPSAGHSSEFAVVSPQPQPFAFSGRSKVGALASAYPVAYVTQGKARLVIKVELGSIAFKNADKFTFVPFIEYARVMEYAANLIQKELLPGAVTKTLPSNIRTFTNARNATQFMERLEASAPAERTA